MDLDTLGDLFNPRQRLALLVFADAVRRAHQAMLAEGHAADFARAVTTYLALCFDRLISSYNSLCRWQPAGEKDC
ncbi:MAG: hypothetical protein RMJ48_03765 [Roseiflexaceae bacterium]|nr:hypothetical protein [Roseiflexaceae bacterium]